MRVLMLNHHARYWGGIEQVVRDTARGLRERGHDVWLGHESRGSAVDAAYTAPFAGVVSLGEDLDAAHAADGRDAADDVAVREVLQLGPDVVYVHKWEAPGRIAAIARAAHVVLMSHDHDLTCPRRHRYTLLSGQNCDRRAGLGCLACVPMLERAPGTRTQVRWRSMRDRWRWLELARELPRVVVASEAMAADLVTNGISQDRIAIVPPVPAASVPAVPPPMPASPRLLYVGQLIRTKGWDLLLDAYDELGTQLGDALPPLTLAGAGNGSRALAKRLARSPWRERIEQRGFVAPEALPALYREASVVVVPSRWKEPFGLVGLEAMAQARPVVAFDVGGIRSWLADGVTGHLVPAGDASAFAASLRSLLVEPQRATEMGQAGHRRRLDTFGFDTYLDRLSGALGLPLVDDRADEVAVATALRLTGTAREAGGAFQAQTARSRRHTSFAEHPITADPRDTR